MIVLQILWLGILLFVVPIGIGFLFVNVDKSVPKLPLQWISGQMLLWAGFQFICVPLILLERSFGEVVKLFTAYSVLLLVFAAVLFVRGRRKPVFKVVGKEKPAGNRWYFIGWILFWVLFVFQMVQAVVMTYADGDDAFYIAEATHAADSELMYAKIPYTGWPTILDVRHAMAPFPIWLSYLSKLSGIRTVSVAHVLLPMALIAMTYGIYYLLGYKLLAKKRELLPLFLVFTELLVIFGDYSFCSVENFMIARSRQGKAALGSIVIPVLLLLLLILLEKLQESQKVPFRYWILLTASLTAGCLCSTMGALLACMLVGITGLCAAVCYRQWKVLLPMAASCIPCVCFAGLYLILG